MQEQIQERQEHADLAIRLDAIESKLANDTVNASTSQPTTSLHNAQHHQNTKTPFKMKIPHFDGTNLLGWILKTNNFLQIS